MIWEDTSQEYALLKWFFFLPTNQTSSGPSCAPVPEPSAWFPTARSISPLRNMHHSLFFIFPFLLCWGSTQGPVYSRNSNTPATGLHSYSARKAPSREEVPLQRHPPLGLHPWVRLLCMLWVIDNRAGVVKWVRLQVCFLLIEVTLWIHLFVCVCVSVCSNVYSLEARR